MNDNLPVLVFLPLFVLTTAAALYQRRHALMVWLGLKEER